MPTLVRLAKIGLNLRSPPGITKIEPTFTPEGKTIFGTMPYLLITSGGSTFPMKDVVWAPIAGKRWDASFTNDGGGRPALNLFAKGLAMIANISALTPKQNGAGIQWDQPHEGFAPESSPTLSFGASVDCETTPSHTPTVYLSYMEPNVMAKQPFHGTLFAQTVPSICQGTTWIEHVAINRFFVPKPDHIYWGFPWEADPLVPETTITRMPKSWIDRNQGYADFVVMVDVNQKTVTKIYPVRVSSQCFSVFSGLGGLVTIVSTVFYLLYVPKKPPVHPELTLFYEQLEEKPKYEHVEMC